MTVAQVAGGAVDARVTVAEESTQVNRFPGMIAAPAPAGGRRCDKVHRTAQ